MKLLESDLDKISSVAELVFHALPFVYWKDRSGRYRGGNQNEVKNLGLSLLSDFIGKTVYEILEDKSCADSIDAVDRKVMQEDRTLTIEEKLITPISEGYYLSQKSPIHGENGEVIGLFGFSMDITEQKKQELALIAEKEAQQLREQAEQLRHENEIKMQQLIIDEKENFAKLARKVAHDINSPIAALNMMLDVCKELPEDKRALFRKATESILDIANNLLTDNENGHHGSNAALDPPEPLLVSDLIVHLLSEKKVQYHHYSVKFETLIANDAQFAFILMQRTELRRALSNLINNGVDALGDQESEAHASPVVCVKLTTEDDVVVITIEDNGKGMSADKVDKILAGQRFTEGKTKGHGIGLQQVWDMLAYNEGSLMVESELGKGTTIQLAFSRLAAPSWIAQEIHLYTDTIIVILDDDDSIHTAWDLRFTHFRAYHPNIHLQHFKQGQEALKFVHALSQRERDRMVFLSDYELLHQESNGLQVIEASGIKGAILVTSYYSHVNIRNAADQIGVKILPKQMASVIQIHVE